MLSRLAAIQGVRRVSVACPTAVRGRTTTCLCVLCCKLFAPPSLRVPGARSAGPRDPWRVTFVTVRRLLSVAVLTTGGRFPATLHRNSPGLRPGTPRPARPLSRRQVRRTSITAERVRLRGEAKASCPLHVCVCFGLCVFVAHRPTPSSAYRSGQCRRTDVSGSSRFSTIVSVPPFHYGVQAPTKLGPSLGALGASRLRGGYDSSVEATTFGAQRAVRSLDRRHRTGPGDSLVLVTTDGESA